MKRIVTDFYALGALTLALCLVAGPAHATAPSECQTASNTRFYDLGVYKGVSMVDQAWASLDDPKCDYENLLDFVDIVTAAFDAAAPTSAASDLVLCHYTGSYDGAVNRAAELVAECTDSCTLNGQMVGEMAAIFYCELSIALGGLGVDEWLVGGEVPPCGDLFVAACEETFNSSTQSYPSAEDPQCLQYTPYGYPPYDDVVYDQARNNQCLYDLVL